MNAVANAGPLIALAKLNLIHLLHRLYTPLFVPSPVYSEVVVHGIELGQPDAYAVQMTIARRDLVVVEVVLAQDDNMTSSALHEGERSTISFARQKKTDWALLDDQLAREQAQRFGLHFKGTLGIIVELHRHSLLSASEVELLFETILNRDDIWISDALVRRVRESWRRELRPNALTP